MAKISGSRGRTDENSGYVRLLGNPEPGQLFSRVQATVIKNGYELPKLLSDLCPHVHKDVELVRLNASTRGTLPKHVFFEYKLPRTNARAIQGDVVVVDHPTSTVYVIELKDGDLD